MSRPSRFVWFGRPTPDGSNANGSSSQQPRTPELRELAVVFKDIPTYRRYRPGAGPRLRPITLVPLRDTTAYIRDEFFVPPALSADGKKRLQYVVGWTDLPAARLQVDAERICDYVSPMAYEEWCAARAAERDEQERRLEEEENVLAVENAEARKKGIALGNGPKGPRSKKRKRQVAVEARTPPPASADVDKRKPGRPRKNVPSLSTPSKSRLLEDFEELDVQEEVELEGTDEEEAIFRQLNGGEPMSTEGSYDSGERSSVPAILEPPAKKQKTASSRPILSKLFSGIETDSSSRSTPFDSSRGATSSPALPPLPQPRPNSQSGRPRETPVLPPLPPASVRQASTPTAPETKTQPQKRSLLSMRDPPSTPQNSSSKAQTPTPKPQKTPSPSPLPATATPSLNPPLNGSETTRTPNPRTGFTPLVQNKTPWTVSLAAARKSAGSAPAQPIPSMDHAPSSTPKPDPKLQDRDSPPKLSYSAPPATNAGRKRAVLRTLSLAEGQEFPEEDNIYEVLRLEGVQERIVRGKRVRYFHVRWKGAWPPGQNPTWEPEGNIPRPLIKKYLIAHPQRTSQAGALDKYLVSSWPHRKYSSVSEAFEGGNIEGAVRRDGDDNNDDEAVEEGHAEEDDGDEMLLVTDEPPQPVKPKFTW